ncbi:MAG TPA: hypothetical protein VGL03_10755 [Thermoanaerobaculia bacterium]
MRPIVTLLREAFEGPSGPSTYFVDNQPNAGIFGTIGELDAADASRPARPASATVAGPVHHVLFHIAASIAWLRGDRAGRDWRESWTVRAVDEVAWSRLRSDLRNEYEELIQTIENDAPNDEELATAIRAVAHAAYDLGAMRQVIARAREGK